MYKGTWSFQYHRPICRFERERERERLSVVIPQAEYAHWLYPQALVRGQGEASLCTRQRVANTYTQDLLPPTGGEGWVDPE